MSADEITEDNLKAKELDDSEDNTYEYNQHEYNAEIDPLSEAAYLPDDDYTHSMLIHRYNYEVSQMTGLRNRSIFILTAIGFLITIVIGIMSANWFSLSSLSQISHLVYALLALPVGFCVYFALSVLQSIESSRDYFLKYPDDDFLELCSSSAGDINLNKRMACRTLSEIILFNSDNNDKSRVKLNKSLVFLFVSIIFFIVLFLVLLHKLF